MKIAVDNQISYRAVETLKQLYKFDIVFRAKDQPDEVWIEMALDRGATVFISPDVDVPNYLDRLDDAAIYKWIDVKQGLKKEKLISYLVKKLKEIT